ncbi:MAG: radical SAM family heme chaperone HemW [Planctomycetota bacterium]
MPSNPPIASPSPTPYGLYVHVPFCETKCGYCDFYSVALNDRNPAPLVDCLGRELRQRVNGHAHAVRTVFFGGGTPTILPLSELARLLNFLNEVVEVRGLEEFTVEANPATVDDEKAELLVSTGVSRVSMGAQSFFPDELATLERLHSPEDIAPSMATLRRHGVGQINLDLIFGIPGQTLETWSQSLARAIDLGPDHIACYGLTYEPGTRLTAMRRHGRMTPCDEDIEADMFLRTFDTLESAGYRQYEISNYAKPGCECRHNLLYWRNEPYIGVGPSAAGCLNGRRYKNVPDVAGYVRLIERDGHAEVESENIDTEMLITEMVMMQLRLNEGLSIAAFRERIGVDPRDSFGDALTRLVDLGLVAVSETHIALTRSGRLVANTVVADLAAVLRSWEIALPAL